MTTAKFPGSDEITAAWPTVRRIPIGVPTHAARRGTGIPPGASRRALDLAVAVIGLLVISMPLLVLMAAVRLESRGPALFRQNRVGQGGRLFTLYKLRSMRVGVAGPEYTAAGDPRVTRLGGLLRRTSADELPQLWNVLCGHMTLVGPRPETPALAAGYPQSCRWIFAHRPGLTGPAQVRMRDADVLGSAEEATPEVYLNLVVPARNVYEAQYLAKPSFGATLGVIGDTVRHLLGKPVAGPLPAIAWANQITVTESARVGSGGYLE
jgi:lipopolysaccharide/colanic/teichoic acid biosynthesis glycosyltransferase